MAVLSVGVGQQFTTLSSAIAASQNGDTIDVQAGTYTNDFAEITDNITIQGVGGMVNLVATAEPPNGKAILTTDGNDTINDVAFSGAAVGDGNGAGIRYQSGDLVLNDDYFHDNQEGLLAAADPQGTLTINDSEFADNSTGDGFTHNLYVGEVGTLTITNSLFTGANGGHEIKSRADNTIIENNRIIDGATAPASYDIDIPDGGNATIENNIIEKGPNASNGAIIHYGGEGGPYANSALTISGNTIVNDLTAHAPIVLLNQTSIVGSITNNQLWGLTPAEFASGPATESGNTFLTTEPTLDLSSPFDTTTPPPPPPADAATATINGATTINFGDLRVGATASQALSFTNSAAAPAEGLDVAVGALTGAATASGTISLLAAGQTDATDIVVGLNTSTAGQQSGMVTLALASDGTGTDGDGTTALSSQSVQVGGSVFREASAGVAAPANVILHVGDGGGSVAEGLTVTNMAANDGFSEALSGTVVGSSGGVTASGTTGNVAAQGSSTGISAAISTAAAGTVAGTVTLDFASDGTGIDGFGPTDIGQQQASVGAIVDNFANAAWEEVSGGGSFSQNGNAFTLNLGTVAQSANPLTVDLGVLNNVTGPSDLLSGSFAASASSAFTLAGLDAFSGLIAGQADTAPSVTFNTGTSGIFSETITLNSTGSNASGYSRALADETLTITGTVQASTVPIVPSGQIATLTTHGDHVTGQAGNDIVLASAGTINVGDKIDGGGGTNALVLRGGGVFDLRLPQTLANIGVIDAQEGQGAFQGAASTLQTVYLRAGTNAVVNVAADPTVNSQNPNGPGITIVGNNDSDVINLGPGSDTVTVGSAAETVIGSGGTALIYALAANAGALIDGGTGSTSLWIEGAGSATLNAGDSGLSLVRLHDSSQVTLNDQAGLTVVGSHGADTIIAGAGGDTLTGNGGADTYVLNAAGADLIQDAYSNLNGTTVENFSSLDSIDLTNLGFGAKTTVTYAAGNDGGALTVSDSHHSAIIALTGQYIAAGFTATSDAGAGTAVTYAPPAEPSVALAAAH